MNIGIDIGGSHIGIALIENEKIVKEVEQEIEKREGIEKNILDIVDFYIDAFSQMGDIKRIGIVAPGTPNKDKLSIRRIVNLGIKEIDFYYILEKYNIPVKVGNDAKAAGLAEFKLGALRKYNNAVFLCLGTGIGSAVFLDGNLIEANKNIGFELGHMVIDKNGIKCNCGKIGCFETLCSMKRFKEHAKEVLNIKEIEPQELLKELKRNIKRPEVNNLINSYIGNLIVGFSNMIDIFEPEVICLGGSFVHFKDIFYNKLVDEMNRRRYYFNKDGKTEIILAELKNSAGMLGAVI